MKVNTGSGMKPREQFQADPGIVFGFAGIPTHGQRQGHGTMSAIRRSYSGRTTGIISVFNLAAWLFFFGL